MTGGRLILLAAAIAMAGAVAARCEAPQKAVSLVLAANPSVQPDRHFRGCNDARAAGRRNITSSDPSYRPWMDGDEDGLACEDHRF
jgi:hypothetical protein